MLKKYSKIIIAAAIVFIAFVVVASVPKNSTEAGMDIEEVTDAGSTGLDSSEKMEIYNDFVNEQIKSELMKMEEVDSVEIEALENEQGEITSVEVKLGTKSEISEDAEKDIREYIAISLETRVENVQITYEDSIPVLFYIENSDSSFYPYWAEWKYEKGEISPEKNALRVTMLPLNYQPDLLYNEQWFSILPSHETGRNVFVRMEEVPHTYHVQTTVSSEFKSIKLTKPDEISEKDWEQAQLIKADYDLQSKTLTFLMDIYTKEAHTMLVGKAPWQSSMDFSWEVFKQEKNNSIHLQHMEDVVLTDEWIYGTNGEEPIRISMENGAVEKLNELEQIVRSLKTEEGTEDELPYVRRILPVGRYQDMVIWKWLVIAEEDVEAMYCLFRNQTFISAVHIQENGMWNVYDKDKNVSTVDMSLVYRNELYFPQ